MRQKRRWSWEIGPLSPCVDPGPAPTLPCSCANSNQSCLGERGSCSSRLSLLTAQWFSGEMTSQLLLGLPWLGVVYLNPNLAPGVSSACSDGTEDLGIKLIPGGREMIYYLLISVNLLTWRNWGLRLSHQNISVLSCSSIKMSSTFQWKPWELKVLVACLRASEASIGILIDFPGSYIELICQNPLSQSTVWHFKCK